MLNFDLSSISVANRTTSAVTVTKSNDLLTSLVNKNVQNSLSRPSECHNEFLYDHTYAAESNFQDECSVSLHTSDRQTDGHPLLHELTRPSSLLVINDLGLTCSPERPEKLNIEQLKTTPRNTRLPHSGSRMQSPFITTKHAHKNTSLFDSHDVTPDCDVFEKDKPNEQHKDTETVKFCQRNIGSTKLSSAQTCKSNVMGRFIKPVAQRQGNEGTPQSVSSRDIVCSETLNANTTLSGLTDIVSADLPDTTVCKEKVRRTKAPKNKINNYKTPDLVWNVLSPKQVTARDEDVEANNSLDSDITLIEEYEASDYTYVVSEDITHQESAPGISTRTENNHSQQPNSNKKSIRQSAETPSEWLDTESSVSIFTNSTQPPRDFTATFNNTPESRQQDTFQTGMGYEEVHNSRYNLRKKKPCKWNQDKQTKYKGRKTHL